MPDFIEPTPGHPAGFPFAEKMAREKAGLSEEDFRGLRGKHLRKDVDFKYHFKAIYLTAAALRKSRRIWSRARPTQRQGL